VLRVDRAAASANLDNSYQIDPDLSIIKCHYRNLSLHAEMNRPLHPLYNTARRRSGVGVSARSSRIGIGA